MSMFLFLDKTYQILRQRALLSTWNSLKDNGGTVVNSEYWGLENHGHKINKNRKGHYAMMRTDSSSEAVQEMERLMRLHEDVMRVLTIKVDKHDEGPSVQMHKRDDRSDRREQHD